MGVMYHIPKLEQENKVKAVEEKIRLELRKKKEKNLLAASTYIILTIKHLKDSSCVD